MASKLLIILPFSIVTRDEYQALLDVNVHGVLFSIKHAGKAMIKLATSCVVEGSKLRIVAASSLAGKRGNFFSLPPDIDVVIV